MPPRQRTLLIFSQVFVPDPASVGQHIADVALEMSRRGHRVIVYCSGRGYENPKLKYPRRERIDEVEVRRFPLASFGKKSIALRVAGTAVFMLQCLLVGLFLPRVDAIFFSTSPPLIGIVVSIIGMVRRIPIAYWAMDLNPDQLIALGKIRPRGPAARVLELANRLILRRSALIIALDRFMADRLETRGPLRQKMRIMPPWPHEDHISKSAPARQDNPFRARHGLTEKFVVMYSGNHSPSNPLTTLLDAAVDLKADSSLRFLFVGGGAGKKEVEHYIQQHGLENVQSLPYQPLSELKHSLSAADVHVVSLGGNMVGIIHPCKIYGAMAVGRPILYLGPGPSHITDLLERHQIGQHVRHGDVRGMIAAIERLRSLDRDTLETIMKTGQEALAREISQKSVCGALCDALEELFPHREQAPRKHPAVGERLRESL